MPKSFSVDIWLISSSNWPRVKFPESSTCIWRYFLLFNPYVRRASRKESAVVVGGPRLFLANWRHWQVSYICLVRGWRKVENQWFIIMLQKMEIIIKLTKIIVLGVFTDHHYYTNSSLKLQCHLSQHHLLNPRHPQRRSKSCIKQNLLTNLSLFLLRPK